MGFVLLAMPLMVVLMIAWWEQCQLVLWFTGAAHQSRLYYYTSFVITGEIWDTFA